MRRCSGAHYCAQPCPDLHIRCHCARLDHRSGRHDSRGFGLKQPGLTVARGGAEIRITLAPLSTRRVYQATSIVRLSLLLWMRDKRTTNHGRTLFWRFRPAFHLISVLLVETLNISRSPSNWTKSAE